MASTKLRDDWPNRPNIAEKASTALKRTQYELKSSVAISESENS